MISFKSHKQGLQHAKMWDISKWEVAEHLWIEGYQINGMNKNCPQKRKQNHQKIWQIWYSSQQQSEPLSNWASIWVLCFEKGTDHYDKNVKINTNLESSQIVA
jgi:hypothetical protein